MFGAFRKVQFQPFLDELFQLPRQPQNRVAGHACAGIMRALQNLLEPMIGQHRNDWRDQYATGHAGDV